MSLMSRLFRLLGIRSGQEVPDLLEHRRSGRSKAAIVFIHGFGGDARKTWGKFPTFLEADSHLDGWDLYSLGYHTTLSVDIVGIWSADPELASLATLLRTRAAIAPLRDYATLTLIAHSMGGLVVQRSLVDDSTFAKRVGHVFLFGTPSGGLDKAKFGAFLKRQIDNMASNGEFIQNLRNRWKEQFGKRLTFQFFTVAGDLDQFVPPESSLEPFPREFQRVIPGDHLSIVKPESADEPSVRLVLNGIIGQASPEGPADSARRAIEMRDFQQAIERLWPGRNGLDEDGLVQLCLALESVGRHDEALGLLKTIKKDWTDAMGTLAGRYKRRWLVKRQESDANRAFELYKQAYDWSRKAERDDQAFYHGINIAFMELAYRGDYERATQMARTVLDHCARAKSKEPPGSEPDLWRLATEGEAHLFLGKIGPALDRYRQAVQTNPKPRHIDSMHQQAIYVASLLDYESAAQQLEEIFRGGA